MSEWSDEFDWSDEAMKDLSPDEQKEAMKAWFLSNFEDPAERTPYESAEGGYIWIWGGPYDASEQLQERFSDAVPFEVIEELAEELSADCPEWAPVEQEGDYEEFFIDALASASQFQDTFTSAILDIEKLLESKVDGSVEDCFCRQLFVGVITALESYLSDVFIKSVMNDPQRLRQFVETTPEFQKEKISVADVYKVSQEINQRVTEYLADVVWHNLPRVKAMYGDTLAIKFSDIGELMKAVVKRHDLVHRNGKTKSGHAWEISRKDVKGLIVECEKLVIAVETGLGELVSE